jgi:putative transcriptional regulator
MATVRVTAAMIDHALRKTDWAKIDTQTDEDIARNVASNPDAPPTLTDAETAAGLVRTIRLRLGVSQAEFARRFQVPIGTLRDWEQKRRQPDATALAYLRVIANAPELVAQALAK